jgi:FkbM family methyltransferase
MAGFRWQTGTGPGSRRLPWKTQAKRWLVKFATKDARVRRMALNQIFSRHGADGVLCLVPFDDHRVFVDPRDDRIAYSLLTGKAWQRAHLKAAFDAADRSVRLGEGGVFVDVGANIGLMTLYALLSGRFSRAVAIEPDPWNRTILGRNLEINGLSDRVTVVGKAVSDAAGSMVLYRDAKNFGAHSLEPDFVMSPQAVEQAVAVDRLDEILAELGIAAGHVGFVKIDVEGHEFAALGGMPELIAAGPPVMIEVTFDSRDGRAEVDMLQSLFPAYTTVVDVEHSETLTPVQLHLFQASRQQHELLIV